jgi:SAM-dependent methyltransferase
MPPIKPTLRCPCDERFLETRSDFTYDTPPASEVRYALPAPYRREYRHCILCGHWFSKHDYDFAAFYNGAYVDASYGNGLRHAFERIMALPKDRSDNYHRVERVAEFANRMVVGGRAHRLLDVGSGLAVFPALMKKRGWNCTALDPDPRAVDHAKEVVGIEARLGDFLTIAPASLGEFDLISFNKVLEHVEDPVAMLEASRKCLYPNGFVYVELPDGEVASRAGKEREEFFIEHHHVFSSSSLDHLARHAGFTVVEFERLQEPSTKFTLRAFLAPAD